MDKGTFDATGILLPPDPHTQRAGHAAAAALLCEAARVTAPCGWFMMLTTARAPTLPLIVDALCGEAWDRLELRRMPAPGSPAGTPGTASNAAEPYRDDSGDAHGADEPGQHNSGDYSHGEQEEGVPPLPVYMFALRRAGKTPRSGAALSVITHGGRGNDRRRRWRLPLDPEPEPEYAGHVSHSPVRVPPSGKTSPVTSGGRGVGNGLGMAMAGRRNALGLLEWLENSFVELSMSKSTQTTAAAAVATATAATVASAAVGPR